MHVLTPEEKQAKKQLIATAASKLFQEHDFNEISMAQIASESGVAKGTLFNYFKTKENIFMYLLLSGYQNYLKEVLFDWQNGPQIATWDRLTAFLLKQNHYLIHEKADLMHCVHLSWKQLLIVNRRLPEELLSTKSVKNLVRPLQIVLQN